MTGVAQRTREEDGQRSGDLGLWTGKTSTTLGDIVRWRGESAATIGEDEARKGGSEGRERSTRWSCEGEEVRLEEIKVDRVKLDHSNRRREGVLGFWVELGHSNRRKEGVLGFWVELGRSNRRKESFLRKGLGWGCQTQYRFFALFFLSFFSIYFFDFFSIFLIFYENTLFFEI